MDWRRDGEPEDPKFRRGQNAEGYRDPTAWEAIRRADRGGGLSIVRRGDICRVRGSRWDGEGEDRHHSWLAVVVSDDEINRSSRHVLVVRCITEAGAAPDSEVEIRYAGKPAMADCGWICSVSQRRLEERIGSCSEAEMAGIGRAMAEVLGIVL